MCKEGSLRKLSDEMSDQLTGTELDRMGFTNMGTGIQRAVVNNPSTTQLIHSDFRKPGGTLEDTGNMFRDWSRKASHHISGSEFGDYGGRGSRKGSAQTGAGGDESRYENVDSVDEMSFARNQFLRKQKGKPRSRLYHQNPGSATILG
tara:strand:- start:303 stop:746 length:444 start_codon:yes stop_codon:yes gene_type:complete